MSSIDEYLLTTNLNKEDRHLNEDKGHCSTNENSFHIEPHDINNTLDRIDLDDIDSPQNMREADHQEEVDEKQEVEVKTKGIQKHRKLISMCPHTEEQYYANGMCKNCYHSKGRQKKATTCEHSDRTLYAKGLCKNCYLSIYHKKKRSTKKEGKDHL